MLKADKIKPRQRLITFVVGIDEAFALSHLCVAMKNYVLQLLNSCVYRLVEWFPNIPRDEYISEISVEICSK